jgi:hypothetical protein
MFNEDEVKFINEVIDRNKFYIEISLAEQGENDRLIKINYLEEIFDEYKIFDNGIIIYNGEENFFINPALTKLYITLHMFKNVRRKKLPVSIIRCKYMDGTLAENIDILFRTLNKDEVELETYVFNLLKAMRDDRKLINKSDETLREKNLYHTFNNLKGLII